MKEADAVEPTPPQGALLDMDGFLLDSMPLWQQLDRELLEEYGIYSQAAMDELSASGTIESAAAVFIRRGATCSMEALSENIHRRLTQKYAHELPLLPGAEEFVKTLAGHGVHLALLTATPRHLAVAAMRRLGLETAFELIVGGAEKHDPQTFVETAEQLGCAVADTIVYDDSVWACEVAAQAGFKTRMNWEWP